MTKTTLYLDASALKESACLHRLRRVIVDGLRPSSDLTWKMDYGTAFHKFRELWYPTRDVEGAVLQAVKYYSTVHVPEDDWRTSSHLVDTCMAYAEYYQHDNFQVLQNAKGEYLLEQKFALPLYSDERLELLAAGTIDALGKFDDQVCFSDIKTTATYNQDSYLQQYELSTQLLFYRYILDRLADLFPTTFGNLRNAPGFIDGVFLLKAKKAVFKRSELFDFPQRTMDSFKERLNNTVRRIAKSFESGEWSLDGLANDACAGKFGPCDFLPLCSRPSDVTESDMISALYTSKPYNPLKFHEK